MTRSQAGFQLLELIVALALAGILAAVSIPALVNWSAGLRVRMAGAEVAAALQTARLTAVRLRANLAVKFETEASGEVTYALYRDGDGDGVRNDDIARGVDPLVRPPQPLDHFGRWVRFGFPPGSPPRDPGGRRLTRLDDPIRFNRSDLASFSPLGTATPGTVYITDGRRHLAAARVTSRSGRIRVLEYDPEVERWR